MVKQKTVQKHVTLQTGIFGLVLLLNLLAAGWQSSLSWAQEVSGDFSAGSVIIGYDSIGCDSGREGALRYNTGSDEWMACQNNAWVPFGDAASLAGLANVVFSSTLAHGEVVRFDGVNWVNSAGSSSDTLEGLADVTLSYPFSDTDSFDTAGSYSYIVPAGVTAITVKTWGAGGGAGGSMGFGGGNGGNGGGGGFVQSTLAVTPGETLTIRVGGGGDGGSNGSFGIAGRGGGGGGYSAVLRSSTMLVQAAGGGGGGGASNSNGANGGAGGGTSGIAGSGSGSNNGQGGGGGTNSAGGAGGAGGSGFGGGSAGSAGSANTGGNASGSGGAGGTHGGGRGGTNNDYGGGGGGGGGGYYGGGGGGQGNRIYYGTGGGGGGGSSYVTGSDTTVTAGSGSSAANTGDADYAGNAGRGATSSGGDGNDGLVVINYTTTINVAQDHILVYDGDLGEWTGKNPPPLGDMEDVNIDSPATGHALIYSGSIWINRTPALTDMGDQNITSPASGAGLRFNGTQWEDAPNDLNARSDVNITSPSNLQVLTYNGTQWVNQTMPATSLASLTDTVISSPTSNQVLTYNGSNWVNADPTPGPLSMLTNVQNTANTNEILIYNADDSMWDIRLHTLFGLGDTDLTGQSSGHVLTHSGGMWYSQEWEIGYLTDVDTSSLSQDHVLMYSAGSWISSDLPEIDLNTLNDVTITSPQGNEVLRYHNASSQWINDNIVVGVSGIAAAKLPFLKMELNAAAPVTCNADNTGAIAFSSVAKLCVCDGATWNADTGGGACSW